MSKNKEDKKLFKEADKAYEKFNKNHDKLSAFQDQQIADLDMLLVRARKAKAEADKKEAAAKVASNVDTSSQDYKDLLAEMSAKVAQAEKDDANSHSAGKYSYNSSYTSFPNHHQDEAYVEITGNHSSDDHHNCCSIT